ncbi:related to aromatic amino acid aminotransferase and related proteins [Phialocephala subalpina]|uniref:Related to aromatic amino acid aminotransferase and related proteins n=1 Tax=Phialocephala subalpina TaxID=576137 RepID=A0A1L7WQ25_9HELO|nr:related to aromatic amino acid aminotransferase and related proteins [Phialocephala subalpina]
MEKKPEPLDLSHYFSEMAKRRTESAITPFLQAVSSSVSNIGAGLPFPGNFPNDTLEGALGKVNRFPLHPVSPLSVPSSDTERFTIPKFSSISPASVDPKEEIDLASALQYQSSSGYPSLAAFIQDWAVNHQNQGKIPYANPGTLISGGAGDGLAKCLMTFADVGDNILVEEFVYFNAKDMILPFGVGLVPVQLDNEGMSAKSLSHILEHWNEKKQGKKPHMMYTVTIGQNPTGGVLKLSRKNQLYKLCQEHDIVIFEDDPYWSEQCNIPVTPPSEFLASLVPSYLTIDVDGRVLSLQTFTKILAPGFRVGWIVAQPAFIEKLTFATNGTTSNPSGCSEVVLSQILLRDWGVKGFVRWIEGMRVNYEGRRNLLCEALAEGRDISIPIHTSANYSEEKTLIRAYDFNIPSAGMYLWVRVDVSSHPLSHRPFSLPASKIILRLWQHLVGAPYSLLILPGNVFYATPEVQKKFDEEKMGFFRLTYVAVEARDLTRIGEEFADGVKTFWEGEGWEESTSEEEAEEDDGAEHYEVRKIARRYLNARGAGRC